MAQWAWQFSGLSHATKVDDTELLLRHAVDAYRSADDDDKTKKAKSVRKLAFKLLNARLKLVKAKRSNIEPVRSEDWAIRKIQIEHLIEIETRLTSEGVNGILAEFGAQELIA